MVGVAAGVGMSLAAPTILTHGSDDVKSRFLRATLTGEYKWCQLFSEPGSGSDLAGLTTKAELDGDEWVITGQKVWNSGAHKAAYGILLARTNWDVPKHKGISFFAIDMRQPGIEVRPLRQANGYSTFNEVFLDEARVPAANIVGDRDNGWAIALTTLMHERGRTPLDAPSSATSPPGAAWPRPRRSPPSTSPPTRGTRSAPGGPTWCPSRSVRPARSTIRWCASRR
ncbi:MAG: acyl-CoA dehydrogenase family protein [Acidimicrobiales bacterium]